MSRNELVVWSAVVIVFIAIITTLATITDIKMEKMKDLEKAELKREISILNEKLMKHEEVINSLNSDVSDLKLQLKTYAESLNGAYDQVNNLFDVHWRNRLDELDKRLKKIEEEIK